MHLLRRLLIAALACGRVRCVPFEQRPLLRQAAEASKTGGRAAAEVVLVDGVLANGNDPTPWLGLGMLHAQAGNHPPAAGTLWASLERLHAHLDELMSPSRRKHGLPLMGTPEVNEAVRSVMADVDQVSAWLQASMMYPPSCARLICPASSDDVSENTRQVSHCVEGSPAAQVLRDADIALHAWPEKSTLPYIDYIQGPAKVVPLPAGGHLMTTPAPAVERAQYSAVTFLKEKQRCAIWPAEHLSFRLFSDIRSTPTLLETNARLGSSELQLQPGERVGSVLHALDTHNFFHFVREGMVPLLLLFGRRLPKLLIPDTKRWRTWVDALLGVGSAADGYSPEFSYVPLDGAVDLPQSVVLYFVDFRRPIKEGVTPFDISWLAPMSGAALGLLRTQIDRLPAASCPSNEVQGGARVVYISRNDSHVRRVLREGKLLDALRAAARVDGWSFEPVLLSELSLNATRSLLGGAAAIVGPHGAGLFNAPLFAPTGSTLIAFGLRAAEAEKEDNLRETCQRVGMRMVGPPGVSASYFGNYTLTDLLRASVVASVRAALRGDGSGLTSDTQAPPPQGQPWGGWTGSVGGD